MHLHFTSGAINKDTSLYEYPLFASKQNNYMCPYCNNDVIIRQGDIRIHHFAHKCELNKCNYYTKPTSQHMIDDVKNIVLSCFNNKIPINIHKKCGYTKNYHDTCLKAIHQPIINNNILTCEINYKFKYNDYDNIADIAFIENDKIKYIIECFSDTTKYSGIEESVVFSKAFNRPDPWFKINVQEFLDQYSKINNNEKIENDSNTVFDIDTNPIQLNLKCLRDNLCCGECSKLYKIEQERNKIGQDQRLHMRKRLLQLRERKKNRNK